MSTEPQSFSAQVMPAPASQRPHVVVSDTLTGKKISLPVSPDGVVRIYACGVTTYDHCHIGHAMQAIFFDVIRRFLVWVGYPTRYVRNFTDVDDKIIDRALQNGESPSDLAERMVRSAEVSMGKLGVRPADVEPRVSTSISAIIAMIQTLIDHGAAYATDGGDVYYRVRSKADYGKLSHVKIESLRSGTRDVAGGGKEDALDFALWKRDDTSGASWVSPWGRGRPGWHIECSAMALQHLGPTVDLHGGGRDLVFPHHENEVAQSESANGVTFARSWLHSGLLTIDQQKMSKSLGNHISIDDFLEDTPAEVLRLAFLQNHYRSNVDFSAEVFARATERLYYFYSTLVSVVELTRSPTGTDAPSHSQSVPWADDCVIAVRNAMADDFNTPEAIAAINTAFRRLNEGLQSMKGAAREGLRVGADKVVAMAREVFGLLGDDPVAFEIQLRRKLLPKLGLEEEAVTQKLRARSEARARRDFAEADRLRQELAAGGVVLMDRPDGTTHWRLKANT